MKRLTILGLLALTMMIFTACGAEEQGQGTTGGNNEPAKPQTVSQTINVYYSDDQLMELVQEEHEITYSSDTEKYEKAIAEMSKPVDSKHISLLPEFKLNKIEKDNDGNVTIDISGQNQYNVGSSGEEMAIQALKKTLFQFQEVQSFKLLIDGEEAESLMGHVDISKPFTRE